MKKLANYYGLYLAMILAALMGATACTTFGYSDIDIDSTRKGILVANAEIQGANLLLQDLVRRNAITKAQATSAVNSLQDAKDNLQLALNAIELSGDPFTADNALEKANAALSIAIGLLAPLVGVPNNES